MGRVKAPGKWIDGLRPGMPAVDAAALVLDKRLAAVELMLQPAAARADEDAEYVHQLRVATRRAAAALSVFSSMIKPKRLQKTRRRLRRIRRAAAAARADDVHLAILAGRRAEAATVIEQAVLDELINITARHRAKAQKPIRRIAERYPAGRLRAKRRKLVGSLRSHHGVTLNGAASSPPLAALAAAALPALLEGMRAAASADLHDPARLHELRLSAKKLRYGLELFASCCGEHFDDTYGAIQRVQGALGEINDLHEIATRVRGVREDAKERIDREAGWRDALLALQAEYEQRLARHIAAFHEEWESGQRRQVLESLAALEIGDRRGAEIMS